MGVSDPANFEVAFQGKKQVMTLMKGLRETPCVYLLSYPLFLRAAFKFGRRVHFALRR